MGRSRLPATVPSRLDVVRSRPHKGAFLVTFDRVDDRDAAEALGGCFLEVPIDEVPPAEDGTWYWFQLVGCLCVDRTAGELGRVVDLAEDGGGLLLVVEDDQGTSLPVPFVETFLVAVDVDGKRIDLDLPPGLIETCASRR
jgi:16S rRNA processing protein RimM